MKATSSRRILTGLSLGALIAGAVACVSFRRGPPDTGDDEEEAGVPDGGLTDATDAQPRPDAPTDAGVDVTRSCNWPRADPNTPRVVVNEIQGDSPDWVELYNDSTAEADISGWVVADLEPATGCPKIAGEELAFPANTKIPAGGTLLVVTGLGKDFTPGPHTQCGAQLPPSCYHAGFGVSNPDGDAIFLLQPGATVIVDEAAYPPMAGSERYTWGRLPSGSGTLTRTSPTPGAANAPP